MTKTKSSASKKFQGGKMFAMAKIMEISKEEQNQVALYLFNNMYNKEKQSIVH